MSEISLTKKDLQDLLAGAAKAGAEAAVAAMRGPSPQLTDGEQLSPTEALIHKARHRVPPEPDRYVPCVSAITGAAFVAVVAKSRPYPQGRVTRFATYTMPEGWDVLCASNELIERNGGAAPPGYGLMPQGMTAGDEAHKNWTYQTFARRDLSQYVGKPLPPGVPTGEPDLPIPEEDIPAFMRGGQAAE
jgi:hypothetical protein